MLGRLIPAAFLGATLLFAASAVEAKMMKVELVKQQEVTLADGKKVTVYVVKMDGHMMVAMPESSIPDALHQQLFKVQ
ncbi:hypothetical protein CR492_07460 [Methylocella silvestris]|uniref:Uncharacterized protein n=2 Tax=Methylocella silvestris TaxID=199596 RepID=A0A2J7TIR1_METSI|nr:hypothetical protein CR492_07460 [Methylocella silvestris]